MSTSGHWEVTKDGKAHYSLVSGGYVLIGTRINGSKETFGIVDNANVPVETYANSPVRNWIKEVSIQRWIL